MTTKKAQAQAFAKMVALLKPQPADDDAATEQWLNAEGVVDSYIEGVEARSADLPGRQELGEACLCLLSMVGLIRNDDNLKLVSELLMPEVGLELYALLPRVQKLMGEAIAELEALAKAERQVQAAQGQPYTDLF